MKEAPRPERRAGWHRSLHLRLALCLIAAAVAAVLIHMTLTLWPCRSWRPRWAGRR